MRRPRSTPMLSSSPDVRTAMATGRHEAATAARAMRPDADQPHVRLESVRKAYGEHGEGLLALDGIDLAIGRSEFVSIIGPSGCGKSTLLMIIAGLVAATSGQV